MNANRLASEKSPYLLQHQFNPVDWYPWNEEAFEKAKRENKPIFLSIGYSTCHWCHVMEKESFEDESVARLMNETFVSIKVDREERPDIDGIYMTVCQMLTGSGGWPLTIIMSPDKKPFFAGTYFPKEGRYGRMGMMELVPKIKKLWDEKKEDILNSTEKILNALRNEQQSYGGEELTEKVLEESYDLFEQRYDKQNGGFGNAHYKSATNQAPRKKTPGWPGEERAIWLRLKLIADVGLLGMPNAGKSTFLAAVSKAKPKIADYPFTTLHPNLGVVKAGDFDFVIADIPGLIEGAHEGTGLGTRFLGHVERTAVLLHLIDCTQDDPVKAYNIIRNELKMYGGELFERKEVVCLTKMDALGEELTQSVANDFEATTGIKPMIMSAVASQNTDKVLYKLAEIIKASRNVKDEDDSEAFDKAYDERFDKAMGINEESYDALRNDE